jgi:hypothetical protein
MYNYQWQKTLLYFVHKLFFAEDGIPLEKIQNVSFLFYKKKLFYEKKLSIKIFALFSQKQNRPLQNRINFGYIFLSLLITISPHRLSHGAIPISPHRLSHGAIPINSWGLIWGLM